MEDRSSISARGRTNDSTLRDARCKNTTSTADPCLGTTAEDPKTMGGRIVGCRELVVLIRRSMIEVEDDHDRIV